MPISQNKARELCSKDEFGVVSDSYRGELRHFTLAEARRKAKHAQKLYRKWSNLAEKQAPLGKSGAETNAAAQRGESDPKRIALKAKIFKEALARYEKYEHKLERQARGEQAAMPEAQGGKYRPGGIGGLFARREDNKAKSMGQESNDSRFARTVQLLGRTNAKTVSGHISTLNQMRQAKRDSRR